MTGKSGLHAVRQINAEKTGEPKPQVVEDGKIVIPKTIDANALDKDAVAIRKATGNENSVFRWADREAINKILEGKSEAERQVIDQQYRTRYGIGLEDEMRKFETGSDLDKFLNILHRKDNNADNDNARRIHEDLLERKNWVHGRSNSEIEKDIRDILSTHNSDQIAKMDSEYKTMYGVSLRDAIAKDPNLSSATKDMSGIYLKGNDKRTDQDTARLIDTALKEQNLDYFAEAMRDASPAARKPFTDNNGLGQKRLIAAFNPDGDDPTTLKRAMDYAAKGKLDASTQIEDNTHGLHMFTNAKGVELAVKSMSDGERRMYLQGKALRAGEKVDNLSAKDAKDAQDYYDKLHGAMSGAGNSTDVVKWEDLIATKGNGSFIQGLAARRGALWNDSHDQINDNIRNLSATELDDAKKHPERREQLKEMLITLNQNADQIKDTLSIYDKMLSAESFDAAHDGAKVSVLKQVDDSKHWYGDDRNGVLNAISNMSKKDLADYQNNAEFRKQLDEKVKATIQDPDGLDAALRMLAQVKMGNSPNDDVIANLERIQNLDGSKTKDAVEEIEKAFKKDPSLRDRILQDAKLSEQFKTAVQNAFGDDYEVFGKPFVEKGQLPIDLKLNFDKGVFSNDYDKIFEDLKNASDDEKKRIISDAAYRQQTIGFMDENHQKIAMRQLSPRKTGCKRRIESVPPF